MQSAAPTLKKLSFELAEKGCQRNNSCRADSALDRPQNRCDCKESHRNQK